MRRSRHATPCTRSPGAGRPSSMSAAGAIGPTARARARPLRSRFDDDQLAADVADLIEDDFDLWGDVRPAVASGDQDGQGDRAIGHGRLRWSWSWFSRTGATSIRYVTSGRRAGRRSHLVRPDPEVNVAAARPGGLRVAFDAAPSRRDPTGVGVYVRDLAMGLLARDPESIALIGVRPTGRWPTPRADHPPHLSRGRRSPTLAPDEGTPRHIRGRHEPRAFHECRARSGQVGRSS